MNFNLTLGILYRRSNKYWNIDYVLNSLKPYNNLKVKFLDVTDLDTLTIPTDLDSVALLPTETDVLESFLSANNIKWVHSMFAGVDKFLRIDEVAHNDSILLTNSRGAFGDSLAEHGLFSMLYFYYNAPTYLKAFTDRRWTQPLNKMIKDKTLTIVGYGLNGAALAKKAKLGFQMNVIGVKKNVNQVEGKEFVDEVCSTDSLEEILPKTDFLVNFLPHTPETVNFFDHRKFSLLRPTSVFINLGRGSAVVEEDLIKCLKNREILGASLDVTQEEPLRSDSPLFDLDNVYLSFHSADITEEYFKQAITVLKKNLDLYFSEGKLATVVDKKKGY